MSDEQGGEGDSCGCPSPPAAQGVTPGDTRVSAGRNTQVAIGTEVQTFRYPSPHLQPLCFLYLTCMLVPALLPYTRCPSPHL